MLFSSWPGTLKGRFQLFLFFLAAALLSILMYQRQHQRAVDKVPQNLTELAQRLQTARPQWVITKANVSQGGIEWGFYVCIYEKSLDELAKLCYDKERGYRWQGVVFCRRFSRTFSSHDVDPGEYGVTLNNNLELFGDPHMISQILSILAGTDGKGCPK